MIINPIPIKICQGSAVPIVLPETTLQIVHRPEAILPVAGAVASAVYKQAPAQQRAYHFLACNSSF